MKLETKNFKNLVINVGKKLKLGRNEKMERKTFFRELYAIAVILSPCFEQTKKMGISFWPKVLNKILFHHHSKTKKKKIREKNRIKIFQ